MGDESNPFLEFEFDVLDKFVPKFGGVRGYEWVSDNMVLINEETFFCDLYFVAIGFEGIRSEAEGVERNYLVSFG